MKICGVTVAMPQGVELDAAGVRHSRQHFMDNRELFINDGVNPLRPRNIECTRPCDKGERHYDEFALAGRSENCCRGGRTPEGESIPEQV